MAMFKVTLPILFGRLLDVGVDPFAHFVITTLLVAPKVLVAPGKSAFVPARLLPTAS